MDIPSVLASFKPRSFVLSEIAQEYLTLRDIDQKPPTVALSGFISLAGDRDVSEYTREDAKQIMHQQRSVNGSRKTLMV